MIIDTFSPAAKLKNVRPKNNFCKGFIALIYTSIAMAIQFVIVLLIINRGPQQLTFVIVVKHNKN